MQPLQIKKFTLVDKNIFDTAYSSLKFPLAEHNFKWLYLNSTMYKDMQWAKINGNLCLFLTFEGNRYIWGPPLGGDKLQETLEICFKLCDEYNKKHNFAGSPAVMYIPEELAEEYSKLKGFTLKHQNQDYIYDSQSLIKLEGGAYKKKRNLIRSLLRENTVNSEIYSKEHEEGCLSLLQRWREQKKEIVPESEEKKFELEADFTERVVKLVGKLELKGIVVFVNGKLDAFTFGEALNSQMCSIFVEKTNLAIKGLSPFVFTEFVKKCWSNYKFINAGEDWGVEYLKVTKMSYHPVKIHKSYMLLQ
jgi:hypothetical protein